MDVSPVTSTRILLFKSSYLVTPDLKGEGMCILQGGTLQEQETGYMVDRI